MGLTGKTSCYCNEEKIFFKFCINLSVFSLHKSAASRAHKLLTFLPLFFLLKSENCTSLRFCSSCPVVALSRLFSSLSRIRLLRSISSAKFCLTFTSGVSKITGSNMFHGFNKSMITEIQSIGVRYRRHEQFKK